MYMPFVSIRARLIFLFILQIVVILFAAGVYFDWQLRQTLEQELSDKLQRLAATAAQQLDSDLIRNLYPGDRQSRTFRNLQQQLSTLKTVTGARRIYVFDRQRRRLLSTERSGIGQMLSFLFITESKLQNLFSGRTVSSTLFKGNDNRLYKTGFAPVFADGQVIAALALEGNANTFAIIRTVRRDLLLIGVLVILAAVFLGVFSARQITRPIRRLKNAAQRITRGDYDTPVRVKSADEIGFLGKTMEEMRNAIVLRDRRQKAMLAGVAHEIRNPLGGIELFAGLLAKEIEEEKARGEAEKILQEVQSLKKIVNEFLDYARPNKPRKEFCNVEAILQEAQLLLGEQLKGMQISVSSENDARRIHVDPQHLKQIFLNLLKNAVAATSGKGSVSVVMKKNARILFSDDGPGVPEDIKDQIFEPFFTRQTGGTGLGLAIVKNLVEENGGSIALLTTAPEGATFELRFSS